jgi:hypothetical protein
MPLLANTQELELQARCFNVLDVAAVASPSGRYTAGDQARGSGGMLQGSVLAHGASGLPAVLEGKLMSLRANMQQVRSC